MRQNNGSCPLCFFPRRKNPPQRLRQLRNRQSASYEGIIDLKLPILPPPKTGNPTTPRTPDLFADFKLPPTQCQAAPQHPLGIEVVK